MIGYNANDMATQGADGFRDGYRAGCADASGAAQEAVAWQRRHKNHNEWFSISRQTYDETASGKWAEKYDVRELYAAPVAAAPGIDLAGLREMLEGWKNSDYPFSYEGQCAQKALNACIADVEGLLHDASPKGGSTDAEPKIWGTQKPGSMPKLFGAHCIAKLNWYPDEGHDLVCMQVIERVQATSAEVGK